MCGGGRFFKTVISHKNFNPHLHGGAVNQVLLTTKYTKGTKKEIMKYEILKISVQLFRVFRVFRGSCLFSCENIITVQMRIEKF